MCNIYMYIYNILFTTVCPFIRPSIRPSILLSARPSVRLSVRHVSTYLIRRLHVCMTVCICASAYVTVRINNIYKVCMTIYVSRYVYMCTFIDLGIHSYAIQWRCYDDCSPFVDVRRRPLSSLPRAPPRG